MFKKDFMFTTLLGLGTFLFYILFANQLPITDPVESNYALTAKEMLLGHHYISPYIYGHPWFDKPVFTYWILMASFSLFGFTDFAARFPSAVTAALSALFMYHSIHKITLNKTLAKWSSLLLITSFEFWYISHAIVTDGYLFFFTIGIFTYAYLGLRDEKVSHIVCAYAFSALAVLTKGPVGLVLPGIILVAFVAIRRRFDLFKLLFHPLRLGVFFLIASPWYIAMYMLHGSDFINGFLGLHNITRATISEHPQFNVWYYYLVLWPLSLLPWIGAVFYELRHGERNTWRTYLLTWGIGIILFYSLMATKYITYTFIALIPFVILGAQGLIRLEERLELFHRWSTKLYLGLPILLFLVLLYVAGTIFLPSVNGRMIYLYCVGPIIVALLAYSFFFKRETWLRTKSICISIILFYVALTATLPPIVEDASAKQEFLAIPNELYLDPSVEYYNYADYDTSLTYYSDRINVYLTDTNKRDGGIWAQGKEVMPVSDTVTLAQHIIDSDNTHGPVLVFVPKKENKCYLESDIAKITKLVGESHNTYLYSNK